MGRLAWCVTHLQLVSLLFGSSLVPHEAWNLSQWGAWMLFRLVVCWQNTLPKGVLMLAILHLIAIMHITTIMHITNIKESHHDDALNHNNAPNHRNALNHYNNAPHPTARLCKTPVFQMTSWYLRPHPESKLDTSQKRAKSLCSGYIDLIHSIRCPP